VQHTDAGQPKAEGQGFHIFSFKSGNKTEAFTSILYRQN